MNQDRKSGFFLCISYIIIIEVSWLVNITIARNTTSAFIDVNPSERRRRVGSKK